MSETGHDSGQNAASAGHEPSEVRLRPVLIFAGSIITIAVVVLVILSGFMGLFRSEETTLGRSKPVLYRDSTGQFPEPKLQRDDADDMAKLRDHEREVLESYGWVNPKTGVARIPIERALEIIAERGLPSNDVKPKPAEPRERP